MVGAVNAVRQGVRSHPRRAWAAAAVALAMVAAGLVAVLRPWGGGAPELAVAGEAHLDAARDLGLEELVTAGLHGDALVVLGTTGSGDFRVAVAEAGTGEIRWVRDSGMRIDTEAALDGTGQAALTDTDWIPDRPVITGSGADWSVVVAYAATDGPAPDQQGPGPGDTPERGVAALSGADGSVDFKQAAPGIPHPLDADEDTVLVGAEPSEDPDGGGTATSMALDSSDGGAVLWEHEGGWVHTLAGDTALGESGPADWDTGADGREDSDVFALGRRTGEPVWNASERFARSSVRGATEGRAVLDADDPSAGTDRTRVVDTATGAELPAPDEGFPSYPECATGTDRMLACVGLDGGAVEVMTLVPGDGQPQMSTADVPPAEEVSLDSVAEGRVNFTAAPAGDDPDQDSASFAVDRDGTLLSGDLPAAVADAAGDSAVLGQSRGPADLALHSAADGGGSGGPAEASGAEPLSLAEEPLWGTSADGRDSAALPLSAPVDLGLETISSVHLADGALLFTGETDDGFGVVAVEAATGEERWRKEREGPEGSSWRSNSGAPMGPTLVGDGVLLVPDDPELGLGSATAFSASDGSVLWEERFGSAGGSTRLYGADSEIAVASDKDLEDGTATAVRAEVRDAADGSLLHTEEDVDPVGIGGGVVVGEEYPLPSDERPGGADDVVGFDPRSGEEQWRLGERYEQPEVRYVDDAAVVLAHNRGTAVLDPASGEETGSSATRITECFGASGPLLPCHVGDRTVGGFPAAVEVTNDAAEVRLLPGVSGHAAYPGLGDWMAVESPDADYGAHGPYELLDAQGHRVTGELAGWPVQADRDHAVLVNGVLDDALVEGAVVTVHERR